MIRRLNTLHPSVSHPIFSVKMKQSDKEKRKEDCTRYKRRETNKISTVNTTPVPQVTVDQSTHMSQLFQSTAKNNDEDSTYSAARTIMGGNNERVNTYQCSQVSTFMTIFKTSSK